MAERRILVVDDEAGIRDLLRDVFAAEGFGVDCAGDAATALRLVRENIYAAALVDFDLPDMDGVMLHRRIREMDPELASATLFMSGLVQRDENLEYYTHSSGGFFAKPFDVLQVVEEVRRLAGRS